jgi:hypothetical protein
VLREENLAHATARQTLDKQVPAEHLRQARIDTTERPGLPLVQRGLQLALS